MSPLPEVVTGNTEHLYNIGVVARMTGVSMATLRAWERRYDFPEAERTAGGHRLYSEKDVFRLRWVKERIDDGMQTAQAINALRHQESTGHFVSTTPGVRFDLPATKEPGVQVVSYQERLYQALIGRDLEEADLVLAEALAAATPEDLILHIIAPTLTQIGEGWEAGNVSIATEHLSTNYLRQKLLMWMLSGPPPRPVKPIVLACAPNEWHEGSLLILGALLRRRRWPVAYLGQSVPLPELASYVRDINPSMVVLIAMTEYSAMELVDWPQWLPEAAQTGQPPVGYGGRVYITHPEWRLRMVGAYLGNDISSGIEKIEELL